MNKQEKYDWMVYVSCMTYNQAQYIEDAMNGFTMQITNFPYVCAVVDDASTDGEQEVIKNYLDEHFDLEDNNVVQHEETDDYVLTFARHKTNQNCYFAVLYLKYNHYKKKSKAPYMARWRNNSKYIAMCEGDDFWISPHKLQLQVEWLENHLDYSSVIGDLYVSDETGKHRRLTSFSKDEYDLFDVMAGFMPGVQNICLRAECMSVPLKSNCNGDIRRYYQCASCGKIKNLHLPFAVYRRTGKGIASQRSPLEQIDAEYEQRYQFHKDLGFNYNRALAKCQINVLMGSILKLKRKEILRCVSCIQKYHIPTIAGFIWYPYYIIQWCISLFFRKAKKFIRKCCIDSRSV